jgi:hypothetical protein
MLGYDLRCLVPGGFSAAAVSAFSVTKKGSKVAKKSSTWVPTSIPFNKVLRDFLALSKSLGHVASRDEFLDWLVNVDGKTVNTARSYCQLLKETEFDLPSRSIADLQDICTGGATGLRALSCGLGQFIAGDEREQIYLVDVFLVGRATQLVKAQGGSAPALIIAKGYAGTQNPLFTLGRVIGRHFALLDNEGLPTPLFDSYFGTSLDDLFG